MKRIFTHLFVAVLMMLSATSWAQTVSIEAGKVYNFKSVGYDGMSMAAVGLEKTAIDDTDLEDYEPEDFFAEDAEAPEIEDAIVVVGGEPTKSGKIERDGNVIRINCGAKLACLCLENGKEFYV